MLKPPSNKISAETREKLLALAEFIETNQKHGFLMNTYFTRDDETVWSDRPECGTAGCIAGFCNLMLLGTVDARGLDEDDFNRRLNDEEPAARHLSLPYEAKTELFYGSGTNDRAKAVRVLRNLAYTGEVDWSV